MADTFGQVQLPVTTTDLVVGDPGLTKLGAFLSAVINGLVDTAWRTVSPPPTSSQVPAVQTVYLHDWKRFAFNENALPALFVWREKGKQEQTAEDWRSDVTTIRVLWALPALPQEEQRARQPIVQAVLKAIGAYVEEGRHPGWFDTGDTDPYAPTLTADPTGFVLAHATTTSPHTFSGAGLNGDISGFVMSPRRVPTITTATAPSGTYDTTATFTFTAVDWTGTTVTETARLTLSTGGETIALTNDYQQIVSIAEPAMHTTAGSIEYGVTARTGFGSCIRTQGGFDLMLTEDWELAELEHVVLDGDQPAVIRLPHHAITGVINVRETFIEDLTVLPPAKALTTYTVGGLIVDQSLFT